MRAQRGRRHSHHTETLGASILGQGTRAGSHSNAPRNVSGGETGASEAPDDYQPRDAIRDTRPAAGRRPPPHSARACEHRALQQRGRGLRLCTTRPHVSSPSLPFFFFSIMPRKEPALARELRSRGSRHLEEGRSRDRVQPFASAFPSPTQWEPGPNRPSQLPPPPWGRDRSLRRRFLRMPEKLAGFIFIFTFFSGTSRLRGGTRRGAARHVMAERRANAPRPGSGGEGGGWARERAAATT